MAAHIPATKIAIKYPHGNEDEYQSCIHEAKLYDMSSESLNIIIRLVQSTLTALDMYNSSILILSTKQN